MTADDIDHINAIAQIACDPLRNGDRLNCTQSLSSRRLHSLAHQRPVLSCSSETKGILFRSRRTGSG